MIVVDYAKLKMSKQIKCQIVKLIQKTSNKLDEFANINKYINDI